MEFDDLSVKSREAENEVNILKDKLQEAKHNLSKLYKDRDCKPCLFLTYIKTNFLLL